MQHVRLIRSQMDPLRMANGKWQKRKENSFKGGFIGKSKTRDIKLYAQRTNRNCKSQIMNCEYVLSDFHMYCRDFIVFLSIIFIIIICILTFIPTYFTFIFIINIWDFIHLNIHYDIPPSNDNLLF